MGYTVLPNEVDQVVSLGTLNQGEVFRFAVESFEDACAEGDGGVGFYTVIEHSERTGRCVFAPINKLEVQIERPRDERVIGHVAHFDHEADMLYTQ